LVRDTLKEMSHSFSHLYATEGRPSVPPEQLLSAPLVQAPSSIRSERQLIEQRHYYLLFRWALSSRSFVSLCKSALAAPN
jgi:transposase